MPTTEHYTFLQRLAIKWLKIPVEKKYYVDFALTTFIDDKLTPSMHIGLSHGLEHVFRVISKDPNDKKGCVLSMHNPITEMEAKYICVSKEGAYMYTPVAEESNWKRKHYSN
jgi:hypothetical protein